MCVLCGDQTHPQHCRSSKAESEVCGLMLEARGVCKIWEKAPTELHTIVTAGIYVRPRRCGRSPRDVCYINPLHASNIHSCPLHPTQPSLSLQDLTYTVSEKRYSPTVSIDPQTFISIHHLLPSPSFPDLAHLWLTLWLVYVDSLVGWLRSSPLKGVRLGSLASIRSRLLPLSVTHITGLKALGDVPVHPVGSRDSYPPGATQAPVDKKSQLSLHTHLLTHWHD